MFGKYDKTTFSKLNKQHNIFVLVGNGFDIAALNKYNKGVWKDRTTSYTDFFEYVQFFGSKKSSNILFEKMKEDKEKENKDWSNFENTIDELYKSKTYNIDELEKSIDELQSYFTQYLNTLVDANILLELNKDIQDNHLTEQTLSYFSRDLQPSELDFASKVNHYDLFNFVFANFNYTSLLDNYLFFDKKQFDPHKYKNVDTNFSFHSNYKFKKTDSETIYSSYILLDVIHPHGMQDIPRSILFGIDLEDYDEGVSKEKRLVKAYWAQYRVKYESYLDEANLFIIYGMSFGNSDAWWMDKIFENIRDRDVELIIYKHGSESIDDVKEIFINACLRNKNEDKETKNRVRTRIKVKTFLDNDTYFLGFKYLLNEECELNLTIQE